MKKDSIEKTIKVKGKKSKTLSDREKKANALLKKKIREQKRIAKAIELETSNAKKLTNIIIEVKKKRSEGDIGEYSQPIILKELKTPKRLVKLPENIDVVKLIVFSNIDIPVNLIKYDAQSFTGWTSTERFVKNNYKIGVMKDLYLDEKGFNINRIGEKIGYLVVTKSDALKIGGGLRLTQNVIEATEEKINEELILVNETFNKNNLEKVS